MAIHTATCGIRNPYLEVYDLYMERRDIGGWRMWRPRGEGNLREIAVNHDHASFEREMDCVTNVFSAREWLRYYFAYAVPNDAAITVIASLGMPVLEIGAGTGYWAWCLEQAGVAVRAFDHHALDDDNGYCSNNHWTTVEFGTTDVVQEFPDHALMLCWPPYDEPMAAEALEHYAGNVLIYIGEGSGGCTGDDRFHGMLGGGHWDEELEDYVEVEAAEWREEQTVNIPQWYGLNDYLGIYRRVQP